MVVIVVQFVGQCDSGAVQINPSNIDQILQENDLVMINFYADWCRWDMIDTKYFFSTRDNLRFSNMLAPIWDQTADKVAQEFSGMKVVIGKIDCDKESELGQRFHITKYPTLKYIQSGELAKKEYRGSRTVDSFVDFIREKVKNPVHELSARGEANTLDDKHRHIVGYFESRDVPEFTVFSRLASTLKEDCQFHSGVGQLFSEFLPQGQSSRVIFKPSKKRDAENDQQFEGNILDFDVIKTWTVEKCSPLVREITFENAEELTEEGLPFLILFHHPDDHNSIKEYSELVSKVWFLFFKYFLDENLLLSGVAVRESKC